MHKRVTGAAVAAVLSLAGCGKAENMVKPQTAALNTFDVEEPSPVAAVQGPQVAYAYQYRYSLPSDQITHAQEQHLALCRTLGSARCLVLGTETSREESGSAASTRLVVDAKVAVAFGRRLDAAVAADDGEQESRSVTAEDVTKQLVDTGAKIRAKQVLAARLTGVIANGRGTVADLVAAEKAYADVQEALDAARTLEATLRRRVAMSEVSVSYTSTESTGSLAPVSAAIGSAGSSFASSLAALISFVIGAIPWLLLIGAVLSGLRVWRRRSRRPA